MAASRGIWSQRRFQPRLQVHGDATVLSHAAIVSANPHCIAAPAIELPAATVVDGAALRSQLITGTRLTHALIADALLAIIAIPTVEHTTAAIGQASALSTLTVAAGGGARLWAALICRHPAADVVATTRSTVELVKAAIWDGAAVGFLRIAGRRYAIAAIGRLDATAFG